MGGVFTSGMRTVYSIIISYIVLYISLFSVQLSSMLWTREVGRDPVWGGGIGICHRLAATPLACELTRFCCSCFREGQVPGPGPRGHKLPCTHGCDKRAGRGHTESDVPHTTENYARHRGAGKPADNPPSLLFIVKCDVTKAVAWNVQRDDYVACLNRLTHSTGMDRRTDWPEKTDGQTNWQRNELTDWLTNRQWRRSHVCMLAWLCMPDKICLLNGSIIETVQTKTVRKSVHTVLLYMGSQRSIYWVDYIY